MGGGWNVSSEGSRWGYDRGENCSVGGSGRAEDGNCGRWLSCDGGGWLKGDERLLDSDNCFSSSKVFKQSRGNEFLVHVDYMLELSKDRVWKFGMGSL